MPALSDDRAPRQDAASHHPPPRLHRVREWFLTWVRCWQTILLLSCLGASLLCIQAAALYRTYITLPIYMWVTWLGCSCRSWKRKSRRTSPCSAAASGTTIFEDLVEGQGSWLATAFRIARYASIDERFVRALDAQRLRYRRQAGAQHLAQEERELFLSIGGAGGSASKVTGALTATRCKEVISAVSTIVAADIFTSIGHRRAEKGERGAFQHTVAVMLPNSVYFSAIWLGVSQSAVTINMLELATSHKGNEGQPRQLDAPVHACSSALLNTNITNNEMFCSALASSGASVLIIDAEFMWLLFSSTPKVLPNVDPLDGVIGQHVSASRSGSKSSGSRGKSNSTRIAQQQTSAASNNIVSLPQGIKRVYLWNEYGPVSVGKDAVVQLPNGMTDAHLKAIVEYNDHVVTQPRSGLFNNKDDELTASWLSNMVLFHKYPSNCALFAPAAQPPGDSPKLSATSQGGRSPQAPRSPFSSSTASESSNSHGSPSPQSGSATSVLFPKTPAFSLPAPLLMNSGLKSHSNLLREQETTAQHAAALAQVRRTLLPYLYLELLLCSISLEVAPGAFDATWSATRAAHRAAKNCFRATDPLLKIFTSGTTGLPKAAKFSHLRFNAGISLSTQLDVFGRTRSAVAAARRRHPNTTLTFEQATAMVTVYNCLPMYHSAGGVFCMSHLIVAMERQARRPPIVLQQSAPRKGCAVAKTATIPAARMVIRKKFSASQYSSDLVQCKVHVVQYIGEILRYALAAQKSSSGQGTTEQWRVPLAFGNGLRRDIWLDVLHLLPIESLVEFYASTEGNVGMWNAFNEPFAVGHMPVFPWPFQRLSPVFWPMFPMKLVQYDANAEGPARDSLTGMCAVVPLGGDGEMLGKVQEGFDPIGVRRFDGYNRPEETQKKLIRDVFRHGDVYFRSGDILRIDDRGFVTFVDRVGDTFRWKGENVSTLEVMNHVNLVSHPHFRVTNAIVYGVAVPGREGKAGMARVELEPVLNEDRRMYATAAQRMTHQADFSSGLIARERKFLLVDMYRYLSDPLQPSSLPTYAIPVFLRVTTAAPVDAESPGGSGGALTAGDAMTTTFKHRTVTLAKEGYSEAIPGYIDVRSRTPPLAYRAPTPASSLTTVARYYVLVKRNLLELYAKDLRCMTNNNYPSRSRRSDPAAVEEIPPHVMWGYIPLDDATLSGVLGGPEFSNCSW